MNYDELMTKARLTNDEAEQDNYENDLANPHDNELWQGLKTVMLTIETGIRTDNWDHIARSLVMLEKILIKLTWIEELWLKKTSVRGGGCVSYESTFYNEIHDLFNHLDIINQSVEEVIVVNETEDFLYRAEFILTTVEDSQDNGGIGE